MSPCIAIIAAGAMGSAVGKRLVSNGCTVLTQLDGRSPATRARALAAGMQDASLKEIVRRAKWVLSILPPKDAFDFAVLYRDAIGQGGKLSGEEGDGVVFADCNAVSPQTVKRIEGLFLGLPGVTFVDAGIIGGPPKDGYDPVFYASADEKVVEKGILNEFAALGQYGLKVSPLIGEGAGVGDASVLKMSYAGITKGLTGLFTTMILAAHASSPATSSALLSELHASQPALLQRITRSIPPMLPKAYRWAPEMEEISAFVGGEEGKVHEGLARVYERVERALDGENGGGDVSVLEAFVEDAKKAIGEEGKKN